MRIKIYQKETYPGEVLEIRDKLLLLPDKIKNELISEKYLNDRLRTEEWRPTDGLSELFSELINVLAKHDIVAYHNTRLINPKDIYSSYLLTETLISNITIVKGISKNPLKSLLPI